MNRYRSPCTPAPLSSQVYPLAIAHSVANSWPGTKLAFTSSMRPTCAYAALAHTHTHRDKQLMHAYISVARSSGTRIKKLDLTRLNELKYAKGSQAAVLRLLAIESESCRCAAGFAPSTPSTQHTVWSSS